MKKIKWADMTDDDDLSVPVIISKHGVKIRSPPTPALTDKTIGDNNNKNEL